MCRSTASEPTTVESLVERHPVEGEVEGRQEHLRSLEGCAVMVNPVVLNCSADGHLL
jgi:hypothetical protein